MSRRRASRPSQQLALLQAAGCNQLQGYLFRRPAFVESLSEVERGRMRAMFSETRARRSA